LSGELGQLIINQTW